MCLSTGEPPCELPERLIVPKWTDRQDRTLNHLPQKFESLRHVPGYKDFTLERFKRLGELGFGPLFVWCLADFGCFFCGYSWCRYSALNVRVFWYNLQMSGRTLRGRPRQTITSRLIGFCLYRTILSGCHWTTPDTPRWCSRYEHVGSLGLRRTGSFPMARHSVDGLGRRRSEVTGSKLTPVHWCRCPQVLGPVLGTQSLETAHERGSRCLAGFGMVVRSRATLQ